MTDDRELVAGSLLSYLEPADRDHLLGLGTRRSYDEGRILLSQGDPTDYVLLITSGWVRVFSSTSNGHEILAALRGPGDVIGEMGSLDHRPRGATVQALESVTAVQLLGVQFEACLHAKPAIAIGMVRQMSERLREAETARMDFAALDVTKRVATFLLRLAQQHGVPEENGGILLRMPLTQQDLANRVGASRRAVARSLAVLRERRIVNTYRRRILIVQPNVLSMFARSE